MWQRSIAHILKHLGMISAVTKGLISRRKTQISAFKRKGCNTVLLEVSNGYKSGTSRLKEKITIAYIRV